LSRYRPDQIALICATGGRSAYVVEILGKNGITGVADVSEGMFGNGRAAGWIARGLPVVSVEQAQTRFDAIQNVWE
jgi:rhodanese-related sulfurtransferase